MDDHAVEGVRSKSDSTLVRAVRAVADGDAEAVVSAGNTGAMLAASLLHIRRLPGVHRPAIAAVIPTLRGPSVLIDAGANADARPEHLVQFGHMGAVFAEEILGVSDPEVRLLSIGGEAEKGSQLTLEAHALLRESSLRFGGNTEGHTILEGDADVVVADGFSGNVVLKTVEGTVRSLLTSLRGELESSLRGKLGGFLIRPAAQTSAKPSRPRDVRWRLPPRAPRTRRHRARLELPDRDRERDRACRARRRPSSCRTPAGAPVARRVSIGALYDPDGRKVRFQGGKLA